MFVRQNLFYLDVGYSHYCLFRVPMSLHLICRKKRVYFASINILYRHSLHFIDRIKKFSVYKSKGLMFASRLKYMQMRIGKKQTI